MLYPSALQNDCGVVYNSIMLQLLSFLDSFEDILIVFLKHQIVLAPILLLLLEEAGLPLPIADFIISYTGYQVSLGHIPYVVAYVILIIADLTGASILYYLCSRFGAGIILRFGKYIDLDKDKLTVVEEKFRKYGPFAIILGRHIPGFRIPITVFSGISEMKYKTFLISTFLSIFLWIPFYLAVGEKLGPRTVKFVHANHWYYLLILVPIIFSLLPFFFLRKKKI